MKGQIGRQSRLLALCSVVILVLYGCVGTTQPLVDPRVAKVDPRLIGVWTTKHKGKDEPMTISRCPGSSLPPGVLAAREGVYALNSQFSLKNCAMFVTNTIDSPATRGYGFASVFLSGDPKQVRQSRGSTFCRYLVDRDTLKLWITNTEGAERLVESKRIKGTITRPNGAMGSPSIDLDDQSLIRYLKRTGGGALFSSKDLIVYKRKT